MNVKLNWSWALLTTGVAMVAVAAATLWPSYSDVEVAQVVAVPAPATSEAVGALAIDAEQTVLLPELPWKPAGVALAAAPASSIDQSAVISPEIPNFVEIPAIKVRAAVVAVGPGKKVGKSGVEWSSPGKGQVGWHNYSAMLGQPKNMVMNGHNNIQGAVFRKLYTVQVGDLVTVSSPSFVRVYQVQEVLKLLEKGQPYEVRVQNAKYIQPKFEDILTMVSCWPETNNTHRIIVIAKPVSELTTK
jgi:LPXTG-site transpeptidase (sortase) family protein